MAGLLAACAGNPFARPSPSPTTLPSLVPAATSTATPVPTATRIHLAQAGTPLPAERLPLTTENVSQLIPYAQWGKGMPQQIAWTPDSRQFAVAATQGLTLYTAQSLAEVYTRTTSAALRSVAISPDGKTIAAGDESGAIHLWNAADGSPLQILHGHTMAVLSLAFSPDGSLLASGSWDHSVRLWNAATWTRTKTLEGHTAGVLALAFTPDGERLISWSSQEQPLVWAIPGGKADTPLYIGINASRQSASSVAFSPQGDLIAANQGVRVRIFRTQDNTTLSQLTSFATPVKKVVISNDGEYAITLEENLLRLWQGSNGQPLAEYPLSGAEQRFTLLSLSPDGHTLVAAGVSLASWGLDANTLTPQNQGPAEYSEGVRLSAVFGPQATALTTTFLSGQVWDRLLQDGAARLLFDWPADTLHSLALSPDQTLAAAGLADRHIGMESVADGTQLATLPVDPQATTTLAFSPDNSLLASASGRQPVRLWRVSDGQLVTKLETESRVSGLVFSPDGTSLATVDGGTIRLWRVADGAAQQTFPGFALAFSPDGHTLAAASYERLDPHVTLWQVEDGAMRRTLPAQGGSLAFSPDGQLLAVAGLEITVWNTASGEKLLSLPSPNPYGQVFFSPDGTLLALSAWDGSLYLWGAP
ncbi:MAG: WD40 repeat domain-containing protein [Chloroflexi bacterium]|nr:WD40 repeat domain-containing protein [Chloroflexota bacterium]